MKTTELLCLCGCFSLYSCSDSFVMIKLNGFASGDKGHQTRQKTQLGLSPNGNEFL